MTDKEIAERLLVVAALLDDAFDDPEFIEAAANVREAAARLTPSADAKADQIKHMVDRFLAWKLPANFTPDGGVSFEPVGNKGTPHEYRREPSGTNLLDATQAEAMVRYMLDGLPNAVPSASLKERAREIVDRFIAPDHNADSAWNIRRDKFAAAIAAALAHVQRETREAASERCKRHADFCQNEAEHGGSKDLFERAKGARYLAERIRAGGRDDG